MGFSRTYKVGRRGKNSNAYTIGLPVELGRVIPEEARFTPELVEEGILYRLVEQGPQLVPEWANKRPL